MARNVTQKDLQAIIDRLNRSTGNPVEYISEIDGKRKINVGHFGLDIAYGGYKLVQTVNDRGGVRDVFHARVSKAALAELIFAYIEGIRDSQDRSRLPSIAI